MKQANEPEKIEEPTTSLILSVKNGKCDICKTKKKILVLRYGFSLCEDCLSICTSILEELNTENQQEHKILPRAKKQQQNTLPNNGLYKNAEATV